MSEPGDLVCRRWVVEGRVQGVGFRWHVMNGALGLGVRGWVRNLDGGGVEVVGLASARTISQLDTLITEGPPGATVTRITREDVPHQSVDSKSFRVKH